MATLTIRKLDDDVYDRLKARAKRHDRSLEAEVRHMLDERSRDNTDWLAGLRDFHRRMEAEHGVQPDSVPLIRAMRDEE